MGTVKDGRRVPEWNKNKERKGRQEGEERDEDGNRRGSRTRGRKGYSRTNRTNDSFRPKEVERESCSSECAKKQCRDAIYVFLKRA